MRALGGVLLGAPLLRGNSGVVERWCKTIISLREPFRWCSIIVQKNTDVVITYHTNEDAYSKEDTHTDKSTSIEAYVSVVFLRLRGEIT